MRPKAAAATVAAVCVAVLAGPIVGPMVVGPLAAQSPPASPAPSTPPPASPSPSTPPPASPAPSTPPPGAGNPPHAPAPDVWNPMGEAQLSVLEKVRAQASTLTVKTGQSATFESLTIAVKSCLVRPPDQIADAAASVEITDSHSGAPGFRGWLLANEPYASMLESPIYDVRLIACR